MKKSSIYQLIHEFLTHAGVAYHEIHHQPAGTSQECARVRGETTCVGGKALVLKVAGDFRLFVLSGALKLDSAVIKERFGVKKFRFATPVELDHLTGLRPGCVPPFGRPILPFALFVDPSITVYPQLGFNAGTLTNSIIMSVDDYLRIAHPTVFPFACRV